MSDLATWEIEHGIGTGTIKVNGEDVSHMVRGLSLDLAVKEVPVLTLQLSGRNGKIVGEGIVEVMGEGPDLTALDAEEIEAEALARQSWGETKSLTQLIIDIIQERAT